MIDETWYQRPPGVVERRGAGGVVVRVTDGIILVALVREDDFPLYLLPKGGVDAGEAPEAAARREILEEAGLESLTFAADLGECERLNYQKTRWSRTRYFLFTTAQAHGRPTDRGRAYFLEWHPLDRLPPMMWPEQRRLIETNRDRIRRALAEADSRSA